MNFQAVIFDLDGTLLNTLDDIANSVNAMLLKYGFPTHDVNAYRYFVGDGATMLVFRALPAEKRNDDVIAECLRAFLDDYDHTWDQNSRIYDGIPELLDVLTIRHVKMAILSNKPDDFTKRCVHKLLAGWRFEVVLGQRNGIPQKPDPSGAHEIAEILGILPARVLYLGDTAIDMKTAVHAGMFPLGALWGFRPADELLEHGAGAIIKKPMALLNYLDGSDRLTQSGLD